MKIFVGALLLVTAFALAAPVSAQTVGEKTGITRSELALQHPISSSRSLSAICSK